jgi:predicted Zn finger-like uncharacterized protein
MIVTCHSCQTRFRVADEKIGPKGARVRCSRCKTVFGVRPASSGSAAPAAIPAAAAPPVAVPAAATMAAAAGAPVHPPSTSDPFQAAPPDDPFARAAAFDPGRTIPDLALEETQRIAPPLRPSPEPSVAPRSSGLLDFGEVDLAGPDAFGEARRSSFGDLAAPTTAGTDDPLAGFSLSDLGATPELTPPAPSLLPPPVDAPPLPAPVPPPEAAAVPKAAVRVPQVDAEQDAAADAERSRKRLRAVGVNALSLVALVALAVVLFQVWRGRQNLEPASGAAAPAVALDVSSGSYDTASGKPVVVVRGNVQATEALRRAEVRVELLDGGRAVAAGMALAGAVPTPEEVHAVASAGDAERLGAGIASRAPGQISAGELLPFAAVVADPPADLRALEVRVSLRTEPLDRR